MMPPTKPASSDAGAIDGIVLLDKAEGISSNIALQRIKRLFRASKAGHCGSLDPLATGLLPLCLGQAVKYSQYLIDADKTYLATATLGVTTTTGDREGDVLANVALPDSLSLSELTAVAQSFVGVCEQIPPMYSALKHKGKALYRYARRGETVARAPRRIHIHRCDVLAWQPPFLRISVQCSKGTYIRTLVEDIGAALGVGAHIHALRRTHITGLPADTLHTQAKLAGLTDDERLRQLLPMETAVAQLPRLCLAPALAARFCQGQKLTASEWQHETPEIKTAVLSVPASARYAVFTPTTGFLGVATIDSDALLCPKRLVNQV